MGAFTNYAEKKLLDHLLGVAAYTMPTSVYVGLLSADADPEDQVFTEVADGSYARQEITYDPATEGNPTEALNNAIEAFGDLASDGSASHFAIFDAVTAGNALVIDVLRDGGDNPTTVSWTGANNEPISFPVGSLAIRLD